MKKRMAGKKGKKVTVRESAKEKPNWSDAGVLMKKGANEKEQAEQAKLFFNELSSKLRTTFHNC